MMAQLTVDLSDEEWRALGDLAADEGRAVAALLREYVAYLLAGGQPVGRTSGESTSPRELAALAQHGGAFNWLADEPDVYGPDDGEPV
jgi:hypothetical protein